MADTLEAPTSRRTYTVDEVAALTGLSLQLAYEAGRRGEIPGRLKVGGRVLFSRDAIDLWLRGQRT